MHPNEMFYRHLSFRKGITEDLLHLGSIVVYHGPTSRLEIILGHEGPLSLLRGNQAEKNGPVIWDPGA